MEQSVICRKAIETFGADHQKLLAIEECSELINALAKEKRDRVNEADIITEIADVQIMCEQLAQMYGQRKVALERFRKLRRLQRTINRHGKLFDGGAF